MAVRTPEVTVAVSAPLPTNRAHQPSEVFQTPAGFTAKASKTSPIPKLPAGRSVVVAATTLTDTLAGYRDAPNISMVTFDTRQSRLTVSICGEIIRSSVRLRAHLTGGEGAVVAVPIVAASTAAALLRGDVTVTVTPRAVVMEGNDTTVTLMPNRTTAIVDPVEPSPHRRRHDVTIPLDEWDAFVHSGSRKLSEQVQMTHLRVAGAGNDRTLRVDARTGSTSHQISLPCSTSDRFGVDLPWPALVAALRPAVKAGATTANLRTFDPNPRFTPLVVTFGGHDLDGWSAVGARKPVIAAA
ncbi:hypothetical protein [Gordonia alkanivorans]|uniref:hypothetical protein n=1 Tax=Gordonia alkanivorans TaxID=84096 RepID=UPI0012DBE404|nr:hypothetical protein [Gordonia alkanivorans]